MPANREELDLHDEALNALAAETPIPAHHANTSRTPSTCRTGAAGARGAIRQDVPVRLRRDQGIRARYRPRLSFPDQRNSTRRRIARSRKACSPPSRISQTFARIGASSKLPLS